MDTWRQDVRYAFRIFSRTPGWTFVIVLSLALGIGANTAIFSIVKTVLLNPLPFRDSDRLMMIWEDAAFIGFPKNTPSPANYADWKAQNHVFESMAAVANTSFTLIGSGDPMRISAFEVTADFFPLLGVKPVHGRVFSPQEDKPGGNSVAILSYGLWQRRFGADKSIVGRDILLNNKPRTVIGIMPSSFQFLDPEIELWVPIAFTPQQIQNRNGHYLQVVGRLKEGVTQRAALSEMKTIMKRIGSQYPRETAEGKLGVLLVPLREELVGNVRRQLILLLLAVAFVLLIACGNIANLLLSKAVSRKKELAVRAALGAGQSRLVRQMLIESLLLAFIGGMVGLLLGALSFKFLQNLIPLGITLSSRLSIDVSVLLYTLLISTITGILFGLVPSLQASRTDINDALKTSGVRSGIGAGKKFRATMVVAETALAVVLLVGAGLLIQTMFKLRSLDIGFTSENVLRMETELPSSQYDTLEKRAQFYERVLERVENFPGVVSAGYSTAVPLDWKGGTSAYLWEGKPAPGMGEILDSNHREVSTRLLQTLGIQLVEGRYFSGNETAQSQPVAVINEAMAATYSSTESALGKQFRLNEDSPKFTVIGIVRNIRNMGLEAAPRAEMYFPIRQANFGFTWYAPKELLIRTTKPPETFVSDMRKIIRSVDPNLPVSHIMTLRDVRAREITHRRMTTILLASFAALALLLAATGIYGVLSYFVNQHFPEFGIRQALGATPTSIFLLILRRGMLLVVRGVALGTVGAFAATGLLQSVLFGVSARDPRTFVAVALILVVTALMACVVPGLKAMRVNPLNALRYE